MVTDAIVERVLAPARLNALLQAWLNRGESATAARREELKRLQARKTLLDGESANVIKLVRSGICSADDPQIATELGNIAAQKTSLAIEIEYIERQLAETDKAITPTILKRFAALIADKLRDTHDPSTRQAYVRLLVDSVEVGKGEIRITGSKRALAKLATGTPPQLVPKAERRWRTRQDSNL